MSLTAQAKEALDIAEETRSLLLACKKAGTPEKLVKANEHYTQRLAHLVEAEKFIEQLHKQNREDLKEIVRLENAVS